MNLRLLVSITFTLTLLPGLRAAAPTQLELRKADRVALIGSGLADRMQHHGWLEALIQRQFAKEEVVIRNLGFAGDELTVRLRSDGVPSQNEWLKKVEANVVVAFWGFNESFKGYEGIEQFKKDLEKFIKETRSQKYDGKAEPRLVLVSPIAQEKLPAPIAQSAETQTNLENYTKAMAEVAAANEVLFVDLFTPTKALFAQGKGPLTINGVHLTEAGDRQIAPLLFKGLFPDAPLGNLGDPLLRKVQQAVLAKNEVWHSRYRTVDAYNIFGGRSTIPYESGKGGPKFTNADVMHPEMAVRDVMTANRDKRVWAVAQGGDLKIDDSNVPPVPVIKSNKPGPNPDESWPYLGAEEAMKKMKLAKGLKVELVASEEQFPELVQPVQMNWDAKGRLWVAAWPNYPGRTPSSTDGDKLLVFEIGPDGKATKCTKFMDDLNCPTGFQFYKDGVLVMRAPDLLWARDLDGDGKAETQERVLDGLDAADSHHETNSMCLEPGGAVYLSDGVFHRTQVETAAGPVRNVDGAIYRYEPRTGKFERYAPYDFANPHGRVFDYWGNDIVTDATGNANYFGPAFSGRIDYPARHSNMNQFWNRPSRPCSGTNFLSSRAFPEEFQGNFLNCNVIGIQGIFRAKVTEEGSGLKGETLEHLITSEDPNFRPSGISVGPDGALYFMDWSNTIIGHLQHHLRDPNRDHKHGRIYRITYEGMPLLKPAKIASEPIEKLLELLKEPENSVRERVRVELGGRDTAQVMAAVDKWVASLDKNDPQFQHHVTEALWQKQAHDVVDLALLKQQLRAPDFHARFAATRVLCYWRDRVPDALALLKVQAGDESPRVRLEAMRAASFFSGSDVPAAIDVTYTALKLPTDYYLDYTSKETLRQLQGLSKEMILPSDPAVLTTFIGKMSDSELLKAPAVEPVLTALLDRKGIDQAQRERALGELAQLRRSNREMELLAALERVDAQGGSGGAEDLGKLLSGTPAAGLAKVRVRLSALAEKARQPSVRRAVWAALITTDGKPEATWAEAKTEDARAAALDAVAYLTDPALRAKFQPIVTALLADAKISSGTLAASLRVLPLLGAENAKANFAVLADYLRRGVERTSAARAILQLPRESWSSEIIAPMAESLTAWAKTVPTEQRTSQDYVETVQAGVELATLLPTTEAIRVRKDLRALGVSVSVVKTVREQMRYDTPRLVVEAGKPFEVIVENVDMMPHNFVVVEPGTRQAVAESVQTRRPDQLDKKGRPFVPEDDKRVLQASKSLEPGDKQTIKMTAPTTEGEYEYVCTFPGHWSIMWGKLIVTKDVDAYLQKPQAAEVPAKGPVVDHSHHQQAAR